MQKRSLILTDGVQNKGDIKKLLRNHLYPFLKQKKNSTKNIMSYNSYISYRRPWDSYKSSHSTTKSSMSSSLFSSPRAPSSGKILRLTSSTLPNAERLDLVQLGSLNTELLDLRSQEREQLVELNDRFATYIEKVRHLELQNRALLDELEALRRQQSNPPRLQMLYEGQVRSLRAMIDAENGDKMQMEAGRDKLRDLHERMKKRYEEELKRRLDAEETLQRSREQASRAMLSNCAAEATVVSLCDELVFLKKVSAEERAELQAQLQVANISVDVEVSRPDLSAALRDIRAQYERLANKNVQAAEDWYRSKVMSVAEAASMNSEAVHAIREETTEYRRLLQSCSSEIDALRNVIDSLNKQLQELEDSQEKEVAKYQVNEGNLNGLHERSSTTGM